MSDDDETIAKPAKAFAGYETVTHIKEEFARDGGCTPNPFDLMPEVVSICELETWPGLQPLLSMHPV